MKAESKYTQIQKLESNQAQETTREEKATVHNELKAWRVVLYIYRYMYVYLLGAVEGTNWRDGERLLKGVDANVGEADRVPRHGRLVSIVNQNFNKTQWENSFERLLHAFGVGAVNSYCEHLWFLLPRYLVRKPRQPPYKYITFYLHTRLSATIKTLNLKCWKQNNCLILQKNEKLFWGYLVLHKKNGISISDYHLSHEQGWRRCSPRERTYERWSGRALVPRRQWLLCLGRRRRSLPYCASRRNDRKRLARMRETRITRAN